MAIYSISDLEKLSGIKAHTIRIWEQRYGIITPRRTDSNVRYYADDELTLLLNVALLNKNGIRISRIANMSQREIAEKVAAISERNVDHDIQLDALTLSMVEMDEYKFDRIISTNTQQIGFERTMLEVIYPFLEKLSVLWLTGSINPAQENFITCLVRQKIIAAIDREPISADRDAPKIVLYLPEGERQELSMLFVWYLLKLRKKRVIYLGQDVSLADLKDAYRIHRPEFIFTMITETFAREPVQKYVDRMASWLPESQILLSGYQLAVQPVTPPANVSILKSLPEMLDFMSGNADAN